MSKTRQELDGKYFFLVEVINLAESQEAFIVELKVREFLWSSLRSESLYMHAEGQTAFIGEQKVQESLYTI